MKLKLWKAVAWVTMFTLAICVVGRADEPERDGPWLIENNGDRSTTTATAVMTLQAAPEPKPALQIRLMLDPFDQVEGNSAIYYLKAMGFFEQEVAAQKIREFKEKNRKLANEKGLPDSAVPPYSWQEMSPQELPVADVKAYLNNTSFQRLLLAEACRRTGFSVERNIRQVESPIAYLLPEIQSIRELARLQSLRCRVALAEHRVDEAIEILKQQFTMARHLGNDEFLISNLVGAAVLSIACQDLIYVQQEPKAPNLYWALAALPSPMIDMRQALSVERQFWSMQLKSLQEVDDKVRPAGYWQDFMDRIMPQIREIDLIDNRWFGSDPQAARASFVSMVAASYPGAKRYLIDECQMDRQQVDAYPIAQVVFLAMKRFNQRSVDDCFKWLHLPYDQAIQHADFRNIDEIRSASGARIGFVSAPGELLLAGIQGIRAAQARVQQQISLAQTIEAIRMHLAAHPGKLPASLEDLPYPAPRDPFNGQPFHYEVNNNQALLHGERMPYLQYRFKLNAMPTGDGR